VRDAYKKAADTCESKETKDKYAAFLADVHAKGVDLPQKRIFVVYCMNGDVGDTVGTLPTYSILVLKKGSERLLSGLGRMALLL
jgi:hypothetical protein